MRARRGSRRIIRQAAPGRGQGAARGRRESLGTRGAARKAHSSDPEDGEIHEGAVVLALGGGDDALDFTDVLPTSDKADGRNPRELVGGRLRVWWPGEGRYFAGVVDRWDESRKLHVIRYDDGDVEAVDLARETWDWEKADEDREGEKGRVDEPPAPSERRGAERTPDLPRAPDPDAPRAEEPRFEPESLPWVSDPNAKQFTCDACGKGPYNAKGIKLHRKMWCGKEGPFVGKKKGVETPGDAKKGFEARRRARARPVTPRSALAPPPPTASGSSTRLGARGASAETSGIRPNRRSRRLARASTRCERRSRTSSRPAPSSSPRFETWIPTPRPRRLRRARSSG